MAREDVPGPHGDAEGADESYEQIEHHTAPSQSGGESDFGASEPGEETAPRSGTAFAARERERQRERAGEEEFAYHTGTLRPSETPDAIEFIDVHKSFGRNHVLRGLNMGLPEDKISMILGPSGTGQVGVHQAHRRAAVPRRGRRARARGVDPEPRRRRPVRDAQEVRRAVPGRRAVRLAEPVGQRRLPAAPAHREGRRGDRRDRQPPHERGRPRRRGREDAQRAVRRDAQARRLRARARARPGDRAVRRARLGAWTPCAPRCCAS